jgi:hypothetical protein
MLTTVVGFEWQDQAQVAGPGPAARRFAMTRHPLDDAFRHNAWATVRLIDACAALTSEQLATDVPGTYGSIHKDAAPPRQLGRVVPLVLS